MNQLDAPNGPSDRAASTPHGDGGSTPVAAAQPARDSRTPAVPGRPEPTVGAVEHNNPDAAPAVFQADDDPGWAASVTGRCAHYIPEGATRVEHHSRRPAAYGVCGVHGFIDEQGLNEGSTLPHCPECERKIAREVRWP